MNSLHQWLFPLLLDYFYSWEYVLSLRLVSKQFKTDVDMALKTQLFSPCATSSSMICISYCDSCNKIKKCHQLVYDLPMSRFVLILCDNWKCRYAGIVSYHYDFLKLNKYISLKRIPLPVKVEIPRSNKTSNEGICSYSHYGLINNQWHIYCQWIEKDDILCKYVSCKYFNLPPPNIKRDFLDIAINHNLCKDLHNLNSLPQ
jgi:hypothetical protein